MKSGATNSGIGPRAHDDRAKGGDTAATQACFAQNRAIAPELKTWMDNVLVPALVRQYLSDGAVRDNGESSISLNSSERAQ
jgi:hypothetical protein